MRLQRGVGRVQQRQHAQTACLIEALRVQLRVGGRLRDLSRRHIAPLCGADCVHEAVICASLRRSPANERCRLRPPILGRVVEKQQHWCNNAGVTNCRCSKLKEPGSDLDTNSAFVTYTLLLTEALLRSPPKPNTMLYVNLQTPGETSSRLVTLQAECAYPIMPAKVARKECM